MVIVLSLAVMETVVYAMDPTNMKMVGTVQFLHRNSGLNVEAYPHLTPYLIDNSGGHLSTYRSPT